MIKAIFYKQYHQDQKKFDKMNESKTQNKLNEQDLKECDLLDKRLKEISKQAD